MTPPLAYLFNLLQTFSYPLRSSQIYHCRVYHRLSDSIFSWSCGHPGTVSYICCIENNNIPSSLVRLERMIIFAPFNDSTLSANYLCTFANTLMIAMLFLGRTYHFSHTRLSSGIVHFRPSSLPRLVQYYPIINIFLWYKFTTIEGGSSRMRISCWIDIELPLVDFQYNHG